MYHVIDIFIDRPHIKRTLHLPVWVRHVTGVLFFPVIPPPADGIPDGEPLGVAGLSLQNERLNVVTNMKIYKKSPVYYEAPNYKTAGGEIFLNRGYGAYDFFACNDTISPNSFAVFKYTNRRNVKSPTDTERFNADFARLKSLVGERVRYRGRIILLVSVQTVGDIIELRTHLLFQTYEFHKSRLSYQGLGSIAPMAKLIGDRHVISRLRENNEEQNREIEELKRQNGEWHQKYETLNGNFERLQDDADEMEDELSLYRERDKNKDKWISVLGAAGASIAKNFIRQNSKILSGIIPAERLAGILSDDDTPQVAEPQNNLTAEEQEKLDDATTVFEWLQTLDAALFSKVITSYCRHAPKQRVYGQDTCLHERREPWRHRWIINNLLNHDNSKSNQDKFRQRCRNRGNSRSVAGLFG